MKNEDKDSSFMKKALYRIWTDDLRLTMALLYHWVKRACSIHDLAIFHYESTAYMYICSRLIMEIMEK